MSPLRTRRKFSQQILCGICEISRKIFRPKYFGKRFWSENFLQNFFLVGKFSTKFFFCRKIFWRAHSWVAQLKCCGNAVMVCLNFFSKQMYDPSTPAGSTSVNSKPFRQLSSLTLFDSTTNGAWMIRDTNYRSSSLLPGRSNFLCHLKSRRRANKPDCQIWVKITSECQINKPSVDHCDQCSLNTLTCIRFKRKTRRHSARWITTNERIVAWHDKVIVLEKYDLFLSESCFKRNHFQCRVATQWL